MAKKKCIPSNPILRDSSVEITQKVIAIESSYNNEFGMPVNTLPILRGNLKALQKDLSEAKLKYRLALKKKDTKSSNKLKGQISATSKDIKEVNAQIKDAPKQFKLLTDIKNILVNNILIHADKNSYDINPNIHFPLIADFLKERYGFIPNSDAHSRDLAMIKKRLGRILHQADIRDDKDITGFKKQMQDPGILMLKQDPTGLAYDLVNKSREAPHKIFGVVNKYNRRVKTAAAGLENWLNDNKYLFQVNIPSSGVADDKSLAESVKNMITFAFDVMDGRAKYIIPKPIGSDAQALYNPRPQPESKTSLILLDNNPFTSIIYGF